MSSKMLQFVVTKKAMPEKRVADIVWLILMKFMMTLTLLRLKPRRRAVHNAVCHFVR